MKINPKIIGIIPARGGSKGLPRKNIRLFAGMPLLAHTIRVAQQVEAFDTIVVTTDDPETQKIALAYGVEAPFLRPAELATDTSLSVPTAQHAVREMEKRKGYSFNFIALLQPTSPLKISADIQDCLERLISSDADSITTVVGVNNFHPWKMKKFINDRLIDYEKPPTEGPPRQSLPHVYIVNGVLYAVRRTVLMEKNSFQGEYALGHIMSEERSVNIDSESDFVLAEYFFRKLYGQSVPFYISGK